MTLNSDKKPEQFTNLRQIGSTGLDVFNDPQDIKDTSVSDCLNVVFDKGYPQPRGGSSMAWDVPTNETNNAITAFAARASDGTNYALVSYNPNFYFRDETNNQWVKINRDPTIGTATITIASPAVVTKASHGLIVNDAFTFSTTGALPTGITAGTVYYVISTGFTTGSFQFSATVGGSAVNTSGSQSGTHSILKNSYTPSTTYKSLMYGYTNWNTGIGSDVMYIGNGRETAIKWQVAADYVSTLATAGATSITLTDATKFPASGAIVIKESNTSEIYTTYTSKSGNVLTIPALASNVGAGACVTFQILSVPSVAIGNIFLKFSGRLCVAGKFGAESTIFGSQTGVAENFVVGTTATSPFTYVVTDGTGGIQGLDSFGEYLVIEKEDSLHKILLNATTASDGTTSYLQIVCQPVATDVSMGPVQPWARIKKNNLLYYATKTEGFLAINPDVTGSQMSVQTSIISQPIQPLATSLNTNNTRTTAWGQKLLWSVATNAVSDSILCYDLNRQIWMRFNNWPVADWLRHNHLLYYVSRVDNKVYQCFTDSTIDDQSPYEAYAVTKRFDFGQSSTPKTMSKIFATGYISANETLKFDVILVTGNQIITIPYQLKGNGAYSVTSIPMALAMAMLGLPTFGNADILPENDLLGIFRIYLAIPNRFGFYTAQIKVYSSVSGTNWGLSGIGFAPFAEVRAPEQLTIASIGDSYVNSNTNILKQENEAFINLE